MKEVRDVGDMLAVMQVRHLAQLLFQFMQLT